MLAVRSGDYALMLLRRWLVVGCWFGCDGESVLHSLPILSLASFLVLCEVSARMHPLV